ncbi:MAG TPA: hypothetical protein VHJ20_24885 [Polyangia bacterium]|nr:hypothetical protein [Polyangia bacterium]
MRFPFAFMVVVCSAACSSGGEIPDGDGGAGRSGGGGSTSTSHTGTGGATATGHGGSPGTGSGGGNTGNGGSPSTGNGGSISGGGGGGNGGSPSTGTGGVSVSHLPPPRNVDVCAGLVKDKAAHPMTALAKPALGATVKDAEFGTTIRRISQVDSGTDAAIVPMYSTISAWNADESLMIIYHVNKGHELYDGKTYKLVRTLYDIRPADVEQVYWHTSDPDVFYYVDGKSLIRYHVKASQKETVTTFSFCTSNASGGDDPMFTSFDSNRISLGCGDTKFIYDIGANKVMGQKTYSENPAQMSPSGKFGWLSDSGRVTDTGLNVLRTLDLKEPFGHSSLGIWPTGEDTWNGVAYDPGPMGDQDIGQLVVFDMTTGKSKVVIGPKTGYPYPATVHVSGLAYLNPGWVTISSFGDLMGKGLMDLEIAVANTVDGTVCRVGRHRSWGKSNTMLKTPYWAEAHAVPSPSGTRILFGSDWGGGATVDAYVLELPSYTP